MRSAVACLFTLAFAAAATAAENASEPRIDYERYLRSDAIVRAHVLTTTDTAVTVEVEKVYLGNVSKGRLIIRQNPDDPLDRDDDSFLFLRVVEKTFEVVDNQPAYDTFDAILRRTLATVPQWQSRGAVSLISYPADPVLTLGLRDIPWVKVWTAYRNDTDVPFDLPVSLTHPHLFVRAADGRSLLREDEFVPPKSECGEEDHTWQIDGQAIMDLGYVHLEPHETMMNSVMVPIEPQHPREEIDITIDDGLFRFDPVHVVVLLEQAAPPVPIERSTSGARPSPRS